MISPPTMAISLLTHVGLLGGMILFFLWWTRRHHLRMLATVQEIVLADVHATDLGNSRDIIVYLPPGYHKQTDRAFDVLYVNDGQERDALGLRETLAQLILKGKIRPIIVVAVPTNANRIQEYGTACCPNSRGLGSEAAAYSSFIVNELKPLIDHEFRTLTPAAFTGVSLGGLSAFDIVWNYPEVFDTVGVMSGSFWWHTATSDEWPAEDPRIAHAMVRNSHYIVGFRGWFQAGTRDEISDRDKDGVIDAIQDTIELLIELAGLGYRPEVDVMFVETPSGRHDYQTWARVLPDFLIWAFSPGSSRRRETR
jgi:pimeloyl-ACP methyl ester carboxylesterase